MWRLTRWFDKHWYQYLLAKRSPYQEVWWKVIWCRMRGHPAGWYNPYGLEPDYTCKECGDEI